MRIPQRWAPLAAGAVLALALSACSTTTDEPESGSDPAAESSGDGAVEEADTDSAEWFVQADYDTQDSQRSATFEGDEAAPYLQYIDGDMTDTSEFKSNGAKKACFANASISNPWRQTGWITMNQQLKALPGLRCHLRDGDPRRR